jgi:hypothetical protein
LRRRHERSDGFDQLGFELGASPVFHKGVQQMMR